MEQQEKKQLMAKEVETLGLMTWALLALKRLFSIAIIMGSAKKIVAIVKTRVSSAIDDHYNADIYDNQSAAQTTSYWFL